MVSKEILESVLTMHKIGRKQIVKLFGCSEHDARAIVAIRDNQGIIREMIDKDLIKSNQKLAAKKQFFQDQNRIERKSFRNEIRLYNDLFESNKALSSLLAKESFKITTKEHKLNQGVPVAVITS